MLGALGNLFLVRAGTTVAPTQAGTVVAQGIQEGVARGQFTIGDQELILESAARTPGGSALNTKQLAAVGALAMVAGVGVGYFFARKRR